MQVARFLNIGFASCAQVGVWKEEEEDAELNHGTTKPAAWMLVLLRWLFGLVEGLLRP